MFFPYETVNALSELICGINTVAPWKAPEAFFAFLHRVIPFDYSLAFVKIDPATYRIVPSSLTLSNGGWDEPAVLNDYNRYFRRFNRPVLDPLLKGGSPAYHFPVTLKSVLSKAEFREYASDFCKKHRIGFYHIRAVQTPEGPALLSLGRPPGSADFSKEERRLLDYLAPHLELTATTAHPESPILFADIKGKILITDPNADTEIERDPVFAARLRRTLPAWTGHLSRNPWTPLQMTLRHREKIARLVLSPAGTRRSLLVRVSWNWSP
ncbi:MAG: hypothetical protein WAO55_07535 [Candidatus Manganitrophaceae bacterium]